MRPCEDRQCDFFVSYTKADEPWAVWIAWVAEEMGFHAMVQAWDFLPGHNWVEKIDAALKRCARVIPVLSPDYDKSEYGRAEWRTAWVKDAPGSHRKLLPVRVSDYEPAGLLATVVYTDLSGTDETTARGRLEAMLSQASAVRVKPDGPPPFPGRQQSSQRPIFPGEAPTDHGAAADERGAPDNVTSLDDFRRRGTGDSADGLDTELFQRLITELFDVAERVGASYAATTPEYTWTRLDAETQLAQTNAYLETISNYLINAGRGEDLDTFTLRHLIRQSGSMIGAFSRALNALEADRKPSRRHRALDEYEAVKRSLEALLWSIHGELATALPPSGSR